MREAEFHRKIAGHGAVPHPRFAIHRNNVAAGLRAALRVRYPALAALLGEKDFAALSAAFAAAGHLPRSAVLIDYGAELPRFIVGHAAAARWPFAADLAALESLWWRAYHAPEAEAAPAPVFALAPEQLEQARFVFHPSVFLLESEWPVGAVWERLTSGLAADEVEPLPDVLLIARPGADVQLQRLAPARGKFLRSLMNGASLPKAVEVALAADPRFDLASEFHALIAAELVTRIDRTS